MYKYCMCRNNHTLKSDDDTVDVARAEAQQESNKQFVVLKQGKI